MFLIKDFFIEFIMNKIKSLGICFDSINQQELLGKIFSEVDGFRVVVTPNVDHVVRLSKNDELRFAYNKSDFCVNDSRILYLLSKIFNLSIDNVITGSDLTHQIFINLDSHDPITIIGASEHTVETILNKFNIKKVHHYNPPMGFIDSKLEVSKCVDFITSNPSKFVFFAVGSPRQEVLAFLAKDNGAQGVGLCIGASLLFLSGEESRAPLFYQKLYLEWLYRLMQNPKRLARRYLIDCPKIFPLIVKEKFK